jgi:hypothetical protein
MLAGALTVRAGDITPVDTGTSAGDITPAASNLKVEYELDAESSFVGSTPTNLGFGKDGNLTEENSNGRLVISPQWNDGPIYRFGLAVERYNFGFSTAAPLPNILQSENAVLGVDFELFSWLVRVEADPGIYSDGRSTGLRDFNMPFIIGGSYIASDTLQWILGLEVDVNREFPVLPGVGVHWTFMDNWVLDAVLPSPRIEYTWSKDTTLYFGGDFKDGTYRVDHDFGSALHRRRLNGTIVEYDEIRVGGGVSWKASKAFTVEMEGGYLPYREFNFQRSGTHFGNESGAPYGEISLNTQF